MGIEQVKAKITPVIEISDISVTFDGFKALSDVTTKIMPNKVHFFIGPNGAGKTTLLDIICGKRDPLRGKSSTTAESMWAYENTRTWI